MSKDQPIPPIKVPLPRRSRWSVLALAKLSERAHLHKEAFEATDNLGAFLGRTAPTNEEVATIIRDGYVVERVMELFKEQVEFAQSVNHLKGWLPDEWDAERYIKNFGLRLPEALVPRVCAAIGLALADIWRDSVNQPFSEPQQKKAEKFYAEKGRRKKERHRGTGPRTGSQKRDPIFKYNKLKGFVVSLTTSDGEMRQEEVAKSMGYGGARQLRAAMKADFAKEQGQLRKHKHTSHKWKIVIQEILER